MAAKTLRELALSITAKFADFKKSTQEVANETAKMKKSAKTASDGFKGLGSTLKDALDNAIPGLSSATNGIKDFTSNIYKTMSGVGGLSKSFKILKVAIASTGIGLLVIALGSLITYFTKTEKGGDAVAKVFGGIKAVVSTVLKTLGAFGEALVKLFQGDFKGAWDTAKGAVKGFGQEVVNAYKTGADAADRLDKLEEDRVAFMVREQELLNQIAKAREIISDNEASVADKQKAYVNAVAAENELYAKRKAFAQEDLNIFLELSKTKERTTELTQEENEKRIAVLQLDEEHSQNMKALNREYRRVAKEAENEKKETEKAAAAAKKMINYQKEVEYYTQNIANLEKQIERSKTNMDDTEQSLVFRLEEAKDALKGTNQLYADKISLQRDILRGAEDAYNQDQDNLDLYKEMVAEKQKLKDLEEEQADKTKDLNDFIAVNTLEYEKQSKEKKDILESTRELSEYEKKIRDDMQSQIDALKQTQAKFIELYGTVEKMDNGQFWNRFIDQVQVSTDAITVAKDKVSDFFTSFPELKQFEDFFIKLSDGALQLNTSMSTAFIKGQWEELVAFGEEGYKGIQKVADEMGLLNKIAVDNKQTFKDLYPSLEGLAFYAEYFKISWKEAFAEMATETVNLAGMMQSGLTGVISAVTSAFGNLFSQQKKGWKGVVTAALGAIQQIVNALLAQAIAAMIAKESSKGLVGLAIAAVGVGVLTAMWNNLVPEFATGAYVDKPTYAMIGERGPEWVLNKGQMASLLSARGGPVEVQGLVRVSGQDLLIAIQNAENFKRSY